jgi:hypothetical protein
MTDSERALEELRLALGAIDFLRAQRAVDALQRTGTLDLTRAQMLSRALGTIRDVMNSFPKSD